MSECHGFEYDADSPIERQQRDWDCSAASTAWLGRSIGWVWQELDVAYQFVTYGIATPQLGLLDHTGAGIVRWLSMQPIAAECHQTSWDELQALAGSCPILIGSGNWYHWVGVRATSSDGLLLIANPAPGWGGIWQSLDLPEWNQLAPFDGVFLTDG